MTNKILDKSYLIEMYVSTNIRLSPNPVDTRRRFNVDATSYDVVRRRIDFETTSCVYWENRCDLISKFVYAGKL